MMTEHSDVQIIKHNGRLAFAVVPYQKWGVLSGGKDDSSVCIPHEVVGLQIKRGLSPLAAWRVYKGIRQQELAGRLGITQSALAQIENPEVTPQQKIAKSLGLAVEQIA